MITSFQGQYRFLSNFWTCPEPILYNGIYFPTVENAYQAAKCKNRQDMLQFVGISPGQSKRLGRKVELKTGFDFLKQAIMFELLMEKFKQKELLYLLKATGDQPLYEGNVWGDVYWGIDYKDLPIINGENILGKMLMYIRGLHD